MTNINHNKDIFLLVQNDFVPSNCLEQCLFYDSIKSKELICMQETSLNGILKIFSKRKIQKIEGNILNPLWDNVYKLPKVLYALRKQYSRIYVLFLNTTFSVGYSIKFLKQLKKRYSELYYILYYLDPVSRGVSEYANFARTQGLFDAVYTFDPYDAQSLNLKYWTTPYSKLNLRELSSCHNDVYFCGIDTDRRKCLNEIMDNTNIIVDMDIIEAGYDKFPVFNLKKNVRIYPKDKILPYNVIIGHMLNAKCILEITRPNQTGLSLRPYEAVVYNKKLITNNKTILSFPYYNPKFMQYFEKISDIDWSWINNGVVPEYNYDNRFSPIELLENIRTYFANTN